jgi:transketolase
MLNPHINETRFRARPVATPKELEQRALALRRQVVRMVARRGLGYLLQGLGAADLFTALYFAELRLDPSDPTWADRDRFILSTAHNTAVFYATLAERGLIPAGALDEYLVDGSPFEVNASERVGPLVEATCGSLGQGLSVAMGMALGLRLRGQDSRVYVILGDGELQEGQVWEAAMSAAGHRLGNLCLIVDRNEMQVEGHTDQVVPMEPIADKWMAFGWRTLTIDGNSLPEILTALATARTTREQPTCIVARTVTGKGVPFLERRKSHVAALSADEAERALSILGVQR